MLSPASSSHASDDEACFLSQTLSLILTPGDSATATVDLPNEKGQVTPKPESQPAKKSQVAQKRQVQGQSPQKMSFQKQNGISRIHANPPGSSTPAPSKPQANGHSAQKALRPGQPWVPGKGKQRSPNQQASLKLGVPLQGAHTGKPAPHPVLETQAPQKEDQDPSPGKTQRTKKAKQQWPKTSKKAAFHKQNGTPRAPQTPGTSPHASKRPPAKRRKTSATKQ